MTAVTITQITPIELEALIENTFKKLISETYRSSPIPAAEKPLSIKEAAEFLNLSITTLYGLTSKHEVPFMKKGKRLYFSKDELLQFVRQGKQKTCSELELEADMKVSDLNKTKRLADRNIRRNT